MNKQVNAFRRITTDRPYAEVFEATEDALRRVGGVLYRSGDGFTIQNGNAGISMAFTADIYATVTVRQREQYIFEINCSITVKPNTMFWVCGVGGFLCLWPLWIVNVFYFMIDPLPTYQRALDQIQFGGAGYQYPPGAAPQPFPSQQPPVYYPRNAPPPQ